MIGLVEYSECSKMGAMSQVGRVRNVSSDTENIVLVGMANSSKMIKEIRNVYKKNYFQSSYSRMLAEWIVEYYDRHKEAPGLKLEKIYLAKKDKFRLKSYDSEAMLNFLERIPHENERAHEINIQWLITEARNYFQIRSFTILGELLADSVATGSVADAKQYLSEHRDVAKVINQFVDPEDHESMRLAIDKSDHDQLFSFPNGLGKLMGPLERGWLVGFAGAMKLGKTHWLLELALTAWLNNYRVAFISLEMTEAMILRRLYQRLVVSTGDMFGNNDKSGPATLVVPVFDCQFNQDNECDLPQRTQQGIGLLDSKGNKPTYRPKMEYQVCTACRGNPQMVDAQGKPLYMPDMWYDQLTTKKLTKANIRKVFSQFEKSHKFSLEDNFRLIAYPMGSATLTQVEADLDILEATHNFIPDVIVIDYADILKPENKNAQTRDQLNLIWSRLKGMAMARKCLVGTASQINRESYNKQYVTQGAMAEDARKNAHVDCFVGLNQTVAEKTIGIMRLNVFAHRHIDFLENRCVTVTQAIKASQPHLDSEIIGYSGNDNIKKK